MTRSRAKTLCGPREEVSQAARGNKTAPNLAWRYTGPREGTGQQTQKDKISREWMQDLARDQNSLARRGEFSRSKGQVLTRKLVPVLTMDLNSEEIVDHLDTVGKNFQTGWVEQSVKFSLMTCLINAGGFRKKIVFGQNSRKQAVVENNPVKDKATWQDGGVLTLFVVKDFGLCLGLETNTLYP